MRDQLKQAAVSAGTLGSYSRNFKFWETFCNDFGFPVWIDELPRARQARMVGLFAALCASEGHNKARKGNKYQTFDGKMAAVAFAHKAVRNAKLDYPDPEFELIAQRYKSSHGDVDRKQPVTTPMLLKMYELRARHDTESDLMWGSIVLGFFFLDRSLDLWGPMVSDKSTKVVRTHCVKAANVILLRNTASYLEAVVLFFYASYMLDNFQVPHNHTEMKEFLQSYKCHRRDGGRDSLEYHAQ
ncbi:hypothetical protein PR001_g20202 [Phytophthora rubi]|uniref:Uncharacterized protein n=1 Tax=Phytophthora rubi TaxID=129364 RepID=A0A6A3JRL4_9STRA|nr:hypothetical protein PR001_g20202 [Phytophthora rubi]